MPQRRATRQALESFSSSEPLAVDLSSLVQKRKIALNELNGKVIAIDAYNVLYQFLSIIREADGRPLTDANGNVTSHLSGLLYRNTEMMGFGIKPIYVFDGIPSVLKEKTIKARMERRQSAYSSWQGAVAKGQLEEAKSFAMASTHVTKDIVESAKELLGYMGIPCINAPGEGEAQCSYMCAKGLAYAVGSQDYDTMLFGAPLVARNLTISGRRKLPRKNVYVNIEPELISLDDTLSSLQVSREQLIWIGIMIGTDFDDGIKGIGPKTALKIAKQVSNANELEEYIKSKYNASFNVDINEVIELFKHPDAKEVEEGELAAKRPSKDKIIEFMCEKHSFDAQRIEKYADKLIAIRSDNGQQRMGKWFGS